MTTIAHIRNMLLEEAILSLIRASGYRLVDLEDGADPTLAREIEGTGVVGRGGVHFAEAIAEARYSLPGNRPQRLLIEAKTYASGKPVDLAVVQQAVGLVTDVNQARLSRGENPIPKRWYTYRYVLCSTTGFSPEAQRYAFAQTIHLLQLDGLPQMAPLLDTIQAINHNLFKATSWNAINLDLSTLRSAIRKVLNQGFDQRLLQAVVPRVAIKPLVRVVEAVRAIPGFYLAVLAGQVMVPLILANNDAPLPDDSAAAYRLEGDGQPWALVGPGEVTAAHFISVPPQFFQCYLDQGMLTGRNHLQLGLDQKGDFRVYDFTLAPDWL